MAVAVNTALNGNPAWLRIVGLTMMIYLAATKVVIPAIISVRIVVLFSESLKYFVKIFLADEIIYINLKMH